MQQSVFSVTLKRLALLSVFCTAMEVSRMLFTGTLGFIFLPWNLFLAWVPLAFAMLAVKEQSKFKLFFYLALWLLFFPNAPYIITDFLHLKPRSNSPFWFDTMLIYSFALTGLVLGIISALIIYKKLNSVLSKGVSNMIMCIAMFLSGYGIYMGRFMRYNSWDILTNPFDIITETLTHVAHPFTYPRVYGVSVVIGILLCFVFFIFESFSKTEAA